MLLSSYMEDDHMRPLAAAVFYYAFTHSHDVISHRAPSIYTHKKKTTTTTTTAVSFLSVHRPPFKCALGSLTSYRPPCDIVKCSRHNVFLLLPLFFFFFHALLLRHCLRLPPCRACCRSFRTAAQSFHCTRSPLKTPAGVCCSTARSVEVPLDMEHTPIMNHTIEMVSSFPLGLHPNASTTATLKTTLQYGPTSDESGARQVAALQQAHQRELLLMVQRQDVCPSAPPPPQTGTTAPMHEQQPSTATNPAAPPSPKRQRLASAEPRGRCTASAPDDSLAGLGVVQRQHGGTGNAVAAVSNVAEKLRIANLNMLDTRVYDKYRKSPLPITEVERTRDPVLKQLLRSMPIIAVQELPSAGLLRNFLVETLPNHKILMPFGSSTGVGILFDTLRLQEVQAFQYFPMAEAQGSAQIGKGITITRLVPTTRERAVPEIVVVSCHVPSPKPSRGKEMTDEERLRYLLQRLRPTVQKAKESANGCPLVVSGCFSVTKSSSVWKNVCDDVFPAKDQWVNLLDPLSETNRSPKEVFDCIDYMMFLPGQGWRLLHTTVSKYPEQKMCLLSHAEVGHVMQPPFVSDHALCWADISLEVRPPPPMSGAIGAAGDARAPRGTDLERHGCLRGQRGGSGGGESGPNRGVHPGLLWREEAPRWCRAVGGWRRGHTAQYHTHTHIYIYIWYCHAMEVGDSPAPQDMGRARLLCGVWALCNGGEGGLGQLGGVQSDETWKKRALRGRTPETEAQVVRRDSSLYKLLYALYILFVVAVFLCGRGARLWSSVHPGSFRAQERCLKQINPPLVAFPLLGVPCAVCSISAADGACVWRDLASTPPCLFFFSLLFVAFASEFLCAKTVWTTAMSYGAPVDTGSSGFEGAAGPQPRAPAFNKRIFLSSSLCRRLCGVDRLLVVVALAKIEGGIVVEGCRRMKAAIESTSIRSRHSRTISINAEFEELGSQPRILFQRRTRSVQQEGPTTAVEPTLCQESITLIHTSSHPQAERTQRPIGSFRSGYSVGKETSLAGEMDPTSNPYLWVIAVQKRKYQQQQIHNNNKKPQRNKQTKRTEENGKTVPGRIGGLDSSLESHIHFFSTVCFNLFCRSSTSLVSVRMLQSTPYVDPSPWSTEGNTHVTNAAYSGMEFSAVPPEQQHPFESSDPAFSSALSSFLDAQLGLDTAESAHYPPPPPPPQDALPMSGGVPPCPTVMTLRYPSGDHYIGEVEGGEDGAQIPSGNGEMRYASGCVYRGGWRRGRYHGRGTIHYPDGRYLDGVWEDGESVGQEQATTPQTQAKEAAPTDKNSIPGSSDLPARGQTTHATPSCTSAPTGSSRLQHGGSTGSRSCGSTQALSSSHGGRGVHRLFSRAAGSSSQPSTSDSTTSCEQLRRIAAVLIARLGRDVALSCIPQLAHTGDRDVLRELVEANETEKKTRSKLDESTTALSRLCLKAVSSNQEGAEEHSIVAEVDRLVAAGADVNTAVRRPGMRKGTALHAFVCANLVGCALACLRSQSPIDFTLADSAGRTVLHWICYCPEVSTTISLLSAIVQRVKKCERDTEPSRLGHRWTGASSLAPSVAESTLSAVSDAMETKDKIDWDQKDKAGRDFLSSAAANGRLAICRCLGSEQKKLRSPAGSHPSIEEVWEPMLLYLRSRETWIQGEWRSSLLSCATIRSGAHISNNPQRRTQNSRRLCSSGAFLFFSPFSSNNMYADTVPLRNLHRIGAKDETHRTAHYVTPTNVRPDNYHTVKRKPSLWTSVFSLFLTLLTSKKNMSTHSEREVMENDITRPRRKYIRIINSFSNWSYPPRMKATLVQFHVDGNILYVFLTPQSDPGIINTVENSVKVRFLSTFDKMFESIAGGASKFNLVVNAGLWYITSLIPNCLFLAKHSDRGTLGLQIGLVCCFVLWGLILFVFFSIKSLGGDIIAETSKENEQLWLEATQHEMYKEKDPQKTHFRSFQFHLLTEKEQREADREAEERKKKGEKSSKTLTDRKRAVMASLWGDFMVELEEQIITYELAIEVERLLGAHGKKVKRFRTLDPTAVTPISCAEAFVKKRKCRLLERHITIYSGRNVTVIQRLWMIRLQKEPYRTIFDVLDDAEYPEEVDENSTEPTDAVSIDLDEEDASSDDSQIEGLTKPQRDTEKINPDTLPLLRLRVLPSLVQYPKMFRAIDFASSRFESAEALTESAEFKKAFRHICEVSLTSRGCFIPRYSPYEASREGVQFRYPRGLNCAFPPFEMNNIAIRSKGEPHRHRVAHCSWTPNRPTVIREITFFFVDIFVFFLIQFLLTNVFRLSRYLNPLLRCHLSLATPLFFFSCTYERTRRQEFYPPKPFFLLYIYNYSFFLFYYYQIIIIRSTFAQTNIRLTGPASPRWNRRIKNRTPSNYVQAKVRAYSLMPAKQDAALGEISSRKTFVDYPFGGVGLHSRIHRWPVKMITDVSSHISAEDIELFHRNGFHVVHKSIFSGNTEETLAELKGHLESILNQKYDRGRGPTKCSAFPPTQYITNGVFRFEKVETGLKTRAKRSKTIHLINVWQCDSAFFSLVTSPSLGAAVARLMGWGPHGCRVAQDQVWIKPPFSGPLSYHRDTPYIDFDPKEVCTVWIPFAGLTKECGTLEYCAGSHKWGDSRRGSANQFYGSNYKSLLLSAAADETDVCEEENSERGNANMKLHLVLPELGGCSIHNGNTWHGSGPNETGDWRCGIGIHYVRGDAQLAPDMGALWKTLQGASDSLLPREDAFPRVVYPLHARSMKTSALGPRPCTGRAHIKVQNVNEKSNGLHRTHALSLALSPSCLLFVSRSFSPLVLLLPFSIGLCSDNLLRTQRHRTPTDPLPFFVVPSCISLTREGRVSTRTLIFTIISHRRSPLVLNFFKTTTTTTENNIVFINIRSPNPVKWDIPQGLGTALLLAFGAVTRYTNASNGKRRRRTIHPIETCRPRTDTNTKIRIPFITHIRTAHAACATPAHQRKKNQKQNKTSEERYLRPNLKYRLALCAALPPPLTPLLLPAGPAAIAGVPPSNAAHCQLADHPLPPPGRRDDDGRATATAPSLHQHLSSCPHGPAPTLPPPLGAPGRESTAYCVACVADRLRTDLGTGDGDGPRATLELLQAVERVEGVAETCHTALLQPLTVELPRQLLAVVESTPLSSSECTATRWLVWETLSWFYLAGRRVVPALLKLLTAALVLDVEALFLEAGWRDRWESAVRSLCESCGLLIENVARCRDSLLQLRWRAADPHCTAEASLRHSWREDVEPPAALFPNEFLSGSPTGAASQCTYGAALTHPIDRYTLLHALKEDEAAEGEALLDVLLGALRRTALLDGTALVRTEAEAEAARRTLQLANRISDFLDGIHVTIERGGEKALRLDSGSTASAADGDVVLPVTLSFLLGASECCGSGAAGWPAETAAWAADGDGVLQFQHELTYATTPPGTIDWLVEVYLAVPVASIPGGLGGEPSQPALAAVRSDLRATLLCLLHHLIDDGRRCDSPAAECRLRMGAPISDRLADVVAPLLALLCAGEEEAWASSQCLQRNACCVLQRLWWSDALLAESLRRLDGWAGGEGDDGVRLVVQGGRLLREALMPAVSAARPALLELVRPGSSPSMKSAAPSAFGSLPLPAFFPAGIPLCGAPERGCAVSLLSLVQRLASFTASVLQTVPEMEETMPAEKDLLEALEVWEEGGSGLAAVLSSLYDGVRLAQHHEALLASVGPSPAPAPRVAEHRGVKEDPPDNEVKEGRTADSDLTPREMERLAANAVWMLLLTALNDITVILDRVREVARELQALSSACDPAAAAGTPLVCQSVPATSMPGPSLTALADLCLWRFLTDVAAADAGERTSPAAAAYFAIGLCCDGSPEEEICDDGPDGRWRRWTVWSRTFCGRYFASRFEAENGSSAVGIPQQTGGRPLPAYNALLHYLLDAVPMYEEQQPLLPERGPPLPPVVLPVLHLLASLWGADTSVAEAWTSGTALRSCLDGDVLVLLSRCLRLVAAAPESMQECVWPSTAAGAAGRAALLYWLDVLLAPVEVQGDHTAAMESKYAAASQGGAVLLSMAADMLRSTPLLYEGEPAPSVNCCGVALLSASSRSADVRRLVGLAQSGCQCLHLAAALLLRLQKDRALAALFFGTPWDDTADDKTAMRQPCSASHTTGAPLLLDALLRWSMDLLEEVEDTAGEAAPMAAEALRNARSTLLRCLWLAALPPPPATPAAVWAFVAEQIPQWASRHVRRMEELLREPAAGDLHRALGAASLTWSVVQAADVQPAAVLTPSAEVALQSVSATLAHLAMLRSPVKEDVLGESRPSCCAAAWGAADQDTKHYPAVPDEDEQTPVRMDPTAPSVLFLLLRLLVLHCATSAALDPLPTQRGSPEGCNSDPPLSASSLPCCSEGSQPPGSPAETRRRGAAALAHHLRYSGLLLLQQRCGWAGTEAPCEACSDWAGEASAFAAWCGAPSSRAATALALTRYADTDWAGPMLALLSFAAAAEPTTTTSSPAHPPPPPLLQVALLLESCGLAAEEGELALETLQSQRLNGPLQRLVDIPLHPLTSECEPTPAAARGCLWRRWLAAMALPFSSPSPCRTAAVVAGLLLLTAVREANAALLRRSGRLEGHPSVEQWSELLRDVDRSLLPALAAAAAKHKRGSGAAYVLTGLTSHVVTGLATFAGGWRGRWWGWLWASRECLASSWSVVHLQLLAVLALQQGAGSPFRAAESPLWPGGIVSAGEEAMTALTEAVAAVARPMGSRKRRRRSPLKAEAGVSQLAVGGVQHHLSRLSMCLWALLAGGGPSTSVAAAAVEAATVFLLRLRRTALSGWRRCRGGESASGIWKGVVGRVESLVGSVAAWGAGPLDRAMGLLDVVHSAYAEGFTTTSEAGRWLSRSITLPLQDVPPAPPSAWTHLAPELVLECLLSAVRRRLRRPDDDAIGLCAAARGVYGAVRHITAGRSFCSDTTVCQRLWQTMWDLLAAARCNRRAAGYSAYAWLLCGTLHWSRFSGTETNDRAAALTRAALSTPPYGHDDPSNVLIVFQREALGCLRWEASWRRLWIQDKMLVHPVCYPKELTTVFDENNTNNEMETSETSTYSILFLLRLFYLLVQNARFFYQTDLQLPYGLTESYLWNNNNNKNSHKEKNKHPQDFHSLLVRLNPNLVGLPRFLFCIIGINFTALLGLQRSFHTFDMCDELHLLFTTSSGISSQARGTGPPAKPAPLILSWVACVYSSALFSCMYKMDNSCRLCRGASGSLVSPCKCEGSMRYVHPNCLAEWVCRKNSIKCEICNEYYALLKDEVNLPPLWCRDGIILLLKSVRRKVQKKSSEAATFALFYAVHLCVGLFYFFLYYCLIDAAFDSNSALKWVKALILERHVASLQQAICSAFLCVVVGQAGITAFRLFTTHVYERWIEWASTHHEETEFFPLPQPPERNAVADTYEEENDEESRKFLVAEGGDIRPTTPVQPCEQAAVVAALARKIESKNTQRDHQTNRAKQRILRYFFVAHASIFCIVFVVPFVSRRCLKVLVEFVASKIENNQYETIVLLQIISNSNRSIIHVIWSILTVFCACELLQRLMRWSRSGRSFYYFIRLLQSIYITLCLFFLTAVVIAAAIPILNTDRLISKAQHYSLRSSWHNLQSDGVLPVKCTAAVRISSISQLKDAMGILKERGLGDNQCLHIFDEATCGPLSQQRYYSQYKTLFMVIVSSIDLGSIARAGGPLLGPLGLFLTNVWCSKMLFRAPQGAFQDDTFFSFLWRPQWRSHGKIAVITLTGTIFVYRVAEVLALRFAALLVPGSVQIHTDVSTTYEGLSMFVLVSYWLEYYWLLGALHKMFRSFLMGKMGVYDNIEGVLAGAARGRIAYRVVYAWWSLGVFFIFLTYIYAFAGSLVQVHIKYTVSLAALRLYLLLKEDLPRAHDVIQPARWLFSTLRSWYSKKIILHRYDAEVAEVSQIGNSVIIRKKNHMCVLLDVYRFQTFALRELVRPYPIFAHGVGVCLLAALPVYFPFGRGPGFSSRFYCLEVSPAMIRFLHYLLNAMTVATCLIIESIITRWTAQKSIFPHKLFFVFRRHLLEDMMYYIWTRGLVIQSLHYLLLGRTLGAMDILFVSTALTVLIAKSICSKWKCSRTASSQRKNNSDATATTYHFMSSAKTCVVAYLETLRTSELTPSHFNCLHISMRTPFVFNDCQSCSRKEYIEAEETKEFCLII
eukprot:gene12323-8454_t